MRCGFEPSLFFGVVAIAGREEMWVVWAMLGPFAFAVPACAQLLLLGGGTGRASCAPWFGHRPLAGASIARRGGGGGRRGGERRALHDPIVLTIVAG